jgi:hypothetical protein
MGRRVQTEDAEKRFKSAKVQEYKSVSMEKWRNEGKRDRGV